MVGGSRLGAAERAAAPLGGLEAGTASWTIGCLLTLTEAQVYKGEWTDPELGKVETADYAETWIAQRPGLRPRTMDLYRWLLRKYIAPCLGKVALGQLSTPMVRQWRSDLLRDGVSVSVAAKAYRLLRAVLMTAVEG